jgi:hypothetical protein
MTRNRSLAALLFGAACPLLAATGAGAQPVLGIEHDVVVDTLTSDRFTWIDRAGQPRVAVFAHNDGQTGPGGTRGGELREFRYQVGAATRIVRASGSAASGFGYVVAHAEDGQSCMIGFDSSSFGHFTPGTFTRVFEGRHHAIFRFTQEYPRYCATGAAPEAPIPLPVTLDWVVATGRDNPLLALTWDMSEVAVNMLKDDARGPYGEMLFDGSATEFGHSAIAGVGWGDRYKFASTANPVTLNSPWTWNVPNSVPYVKLWTTNVDATMGTVQTQTIVQQDAGGYWGVDRWNTTSASGSACPAGDGTPHVMPCTYNWPYQNINYSFYDGLGVLQVNSATNSTRLAWGTNFGFLGQTSYLIHGSEYYGGPLADTPAPGHPRKSYSTFVVLGPHSTDPVGAAVSEIEAVQTTSITGGLGRALSSGPAGANRPDFMAYSPVGWNHVYAAWALGGAENQVDATFSVGSGTISNPVLTVAGWTGGAFPSAVRFNGVALEQETDYYPSVRSDTRELWLTLKRNLTLAPGRLEISGSARERRIADFDLDFKSDPTVYHQASGSWFMRNSTTGATTSSGLGGPGYTAVRGDFDGDRKTDVAVYHPASGVWYVRRSSDGVTSAIGYGGPQYIPTPGDYDGDGRTNIAAYHPPSGLWNIRNPDTGATTTVGFGGNGYAPLRGDFDGDARTDVAVYHAASGLWFLRASSTNVVTTVGYGGNGYQPVPADYDGDGRSDVAVYHPASGLWFLRSSSTGTSSTVGFGGNGYDPVVGDYDSDGRSDLAVFHPSTGLWFIRFSRTGASTSFGFGGPGYVPVN